MATYKAVLHVFVLFPARQRVGVRQRSVGCGSAVSTLCTIYCVRVKIAHTNQRAATPSQPQASRRAVLPVMLMRPDGWHAMRRKLQTGTGKNRKRKTSGPVIGFSRRETPRGVSHASVNQSRIYHSLVHTRHNRTAYTKVLDCMCRRLWNRKGLHVSSIMAHPRTSAFSLCLQPLPSASRAFQPVAYALPKPSCRRRTPVDSDRPLRCGGVRRSTHMHSRSHSRSH